MKTKIVEIIVKGVTVLVAISGIIGLEYIALSKGINGVALTTAIAGIAGLGGYEIDKVIKIFKGGKE